MTAEHPDNDSDAFVAKVAKAIYLARKNPVNRKESRDFVYLTGLEQHPYIRMAKAAIEAMRE